MCCFGIEDGNVKKIYSADFRAGKTLSNVQKTRLKGSYIASRHASGWRADVKVMPWPEKMKDLVTQCWAEVRFRPA
jgi:hypothetical protein